MFSFNKKYKDNNLNDNFITLIQLAREDEMIKNQIKTIINLEPYKRKNFIEEILKKLKNNSAPIEFIEAISYMVDDNICIKIKELLNN